MNANPNKQEDEDAKELESGPQANRPSDSGEINATGESGEVPAVKPSHIQEILRSGRHGVQGTLQGIGSPKVPNLEELELDDLPEEELREDVKMFSIREVGPGNSALREHCLSSNIIPDPLISQEEVKRAGDILIGFLDWRDVVLSKHIEHVENARKILMNAILSGIKGASEVDGQVRASIRSAQERNRKASGKRKRTLGAAAPTPPPPPKREKNSDSASGTKKKAVPPPKPKNRPNRGTAVTKRQFGDLPAPTRATLPPRPIAIKLPNGAIFGLTVKNASEYPSRLATLQQQIESGQFDGAWTKELLWEIVNQMDELTDQYPNDARILASAESVNNACQAIDSASKEDGGKAKKKVKGGGNGDGGGDDGDGNDHEGAWTDDEKALEALGQSMQAARATLTDSKENPNPSDRETLISHIADINQFSPLKNKKADELITEIEAWMAHLKSPIVIEGKSGKMELSMEDEKAAVRLVDTIKIGELTDECLVTLKTELRRLEHFNNDDLSEKLSVVQEGVRFEIKRREDFANLGGQIERTVDDPSDENLKQLDDLKKKLEEEYLGPDKDRIEQGTDVGFIRAAEKMIQNDPRFEEVRKILKVINTKKDDSALTHREAQEVLAELFGKDDIVRPNDISRSLHNLRKINAAIESCKRIPNIVERKIEDRKKRTLPIMGETINIPGNTERAIAVLRGVLAKVQASKDISANDLHEFEAWTSGGIIESHDDNDELVGVLGDIIDAMAQSKNTADNDGGESDDHGAEGNGDGDNGDGGGEKSDMEKAIDDLRSMTSFERGTHLLGLLNKFPTEMEAIKKRASEENLVPKGFFDQAEHFEKNSQSENKKVRNEARARTAYLDAMIAKLPMIKSMKVRRIQKKHYNGWSNEDMKALLAFMGFNRPPNFYDVLQAAYKLKNTDALTYGTLKAKAAREEPLGLEGLHQDGWRPYHYTALLVALGARVDKSRTLRSDPPPPRSAPIPPPKPKPSPVPKGFISAEMLEGGYADMEGLEDEFMSIINDEKEGGKELEENVSILFKILSAKKEDFANDGGWKKIKRRKHFVKERITAMLEEMVPKETPKDELLEEMGKLDEGHKTASGKTVLEIIQREVKNAQDNIDLYKSKVRKDEPIELTRKADPTPAPEPEPPPASEPEPISVQEEPISTFDATLARLEQDNRVKTAMGLIGQALEYSSKPASLIYALQAAVRGNLNDIVMNPELNDDEKKAEILGITSDKVAGNIFIDLQKLIQEQQK